MNRIKTFIIILYLFTLVSCANGNAGREGLTSDALINGFQARSPVEESWLTMPEWAQAPRHVFEGRLELLGESQNGEASLLRGNVDLPVHLPEFDFEFVQQDGYLIPLQRALIITGHEHWNYILEPGRVWYEPGDESYSRASFPFALSWKGSNAIHNGTMTFLFNDEDISKVWYQVTQETAINVRANMWGLLDARYHSGPVAGGEAVKAAFIQEREAVFPTKPIEALEDDYPGIDLNAFGQGITPEAMTWYGFVIDGVNYLGGCQTRYGVYPYCEYLRAPSYSTAKSAFASLVLMRLAQKYGPDVAESLVKDYVPEAATSIGDWSAVTFDHVLDMATGNYRSSARMVDEEHWDTDPFWLADDYETKIEAAFNWPNSAPPGTTWVYRTFDTFIVTRAMQNYLIDREGKGADIFEFVVDEVYKPLKMSPGVFSTLRTSDDNWSGQPYGGYGLWWIPDDLAKISAFLNVDTGKIGEEQILHPGLLAAALQRNPDDRGVIRDGNGRYNNAFWADPVQSQERDGCAFWVVHMYGFSGIVVTLMPNGTAYYYASDNQEFTSKAAVHESDKLLPMCLLGD